MIFLWILALILSLIVLTYLFLCTKRLLLLLRLIRYGNIQWLRFPFRSVFIPDGKIDFTAQIGSETVSVILLTTPFKRCRYHFREDQKLEIIFARRGVHILNTRGRPRAAATIDNVFTITRFPLKIKQENLSSAYYLIPHPAPFEATGIYENKLQALDNNDFLYDGIRICGWSYFRKQVLDKI